MPKKHVQPKAKHAPIGASAVHGPAKEANPSCCCSAGNSGILVFAALAVLLVIGAWYFSQPTPQVPKEVVKPGDYVSFDYVAYLDSDGSVVDSSIQQVAQAAGLYDATRQYVPLRVRVKAPVAEVISGVENALIGMYLGEEKNVSITAADAYGDWNPGRTVYVPKIQSSTRLQQVSRDALEASIGNSLSQDLVNSSLSLGAVNATLVSFDDSVAVLSYDFAPGQSIHIPSAAIPLENGALALQFAPLEGVVTDVTSDSISFQIIAPETGTYFISNSGTGQVLPARPKRENETHIVFDFNHPLAGEDLVFYLKVTNFSSTSN